MCVCAYLCVCVDVLVCTSVPIYLMCGCGRLRKSHFTSNHFLQPPKSQVHVSMSFGSTGSRFRMNFHSSQILLIGDIIQGISDFIRDLSADLAYVISVISPPKAPNIEYSLDSLDPSVSDDLLSQSFADAANANASVWEIGFVHSEFILPKNSHAESPDVLSLLVGCVNCT